MIFGGATQDTQLTDCAAETNLEEGEGQIITCHVEDCISPTHKHKCGKWLHRENHNKRLHTLTITKTHVNHSKLKKLQKKTTNSHCEKKATAHMVDEQKFRTTQKPDHTETGPLSLEGLPHRRPQERSVVDEQTVSHMESTQVKPPPGPVQDHTAPNARLENGRDGVWGGGEGGGCNSPWVWSRMLGQSGRS